MAFSSRASASAYIPATSRLASIYSGQTGFDIYSRAVSDVYQDLYGEGNFHRERHIRCGCATGRCWSIASRAMPC